MRSPMPSHCLRIYIVRSRGPPHQRCLLHCNCPFTNRRMNKPNKKEIGLAAVLWFLLDCITRGIRAVQIPGEDLPYDVITDWNGALRRVQVRCAYFDKSSKRWIANLGRHIPAISPKGNRSTKNVPFDKDSVDIVAVRAGTEWYFFDHPDRLPSSVALHHLPSKRPRRSDGAKNQWELLRVAPAASHLTGNTHGTIFHRDAGRLRHCAYFGTAICSRPYRGARRRKVQRQDVET